MTLNAQRQSFSATFRQPAHNFLMLLLFFSSLLGNLHAAELLRVESTNARKQVTTEQTNLCIAAVTISTEVLKSQESLAENRREACPGYSGGFDSDQDGDGFIDSVDGCPTVAGVGFPDPYDEASGCPDPDADGVPNTGLDACPAEPGIIIYPFSENGQFHQSTGCPDLDGDGIPNPDDPDMDGDGFSNHVDGCPAASGVLFSSPYDEASGCPDPDADAVPNTGLDACPNQRGIVIYPFSNNGQYHQSTGCPDLDGDGIPNPNDPDMDGDSFANAADACPIVAGASYPAPHQNDSGCPYSPDINNFGSSFNQQLIGHTALMDYWTNSGSDLDNYAPVWGRGVSLGISEGWLNPLLLNTYEGLPTEIHVNDNGDEIPYRSTRFFDEDINLFADQIPGVTPVDPYFPLSLTYDQFEFDFGFPETPLQNLTYSNYYPNSNDHVNVVAQFSLGGSVSARGVTDIRSWSFLGIPDPLKLWMTDNPAETDFEPADVYTSAEGNAISSNSLPAFERLVDTYDTLYFSAAGNGLNHPPYTIPVLRSTQSSYNGITVGASPVTYGTGSGQIETSYGTPSGYYGAGGRLKPEITASNGNPFTSFIAPTVAAMTARLKETARHVHGLGSDIHRSEVMKAVILSGATKTIAFTPPYNQYGWSRSEVKPMDERFGAGVFNIFNGHNLISASEQTLVPLDEAVLNGLLNGAVSSIPGTSNLTGWSYSSLAGGDHKMITFPAPGNDTSLGHDFHFTTVWNIKTHEGLQNLPLVNLDLMLLAWAADGTATVIDRSRSTIDNLEHFWHEQLPAAVAYTVVISNRSETATDFGLAWRATEP